LKKSLKEIRDELFGKDTGEVTKTRVNVKKISLESLGRSKPTSRPTWKRKLKNYLDEDELG
jgi:hypothetical protein